MSNKRLLYYLIYKKKKIKFKEKICCYFICQKYKHVKEEKEKMEKLSNENLKYYKIEKDKKMN